MDLQNRLYKMRRAKGLSQESLAEILGVTRQTVSKWETGQTTPDFDKILPLCELYGITADELLKGEKAAAAESAGCQACGENAASTAESETPPDGEILEKRLRRSILFTAAAVCFYILTVIPFFLCDDYKHMLAMFFTIAAAAVFFTIMAAVSLSMALAALIKRKKGKPDTAAPKHAKAEESKGIRRQISGILAPVFLAIYLSVSFLTGAWHITWMLWVVYAVICKIVKLAFVLKGWETDDAK